jgi:Flp pilus assembly protein TadD
MVGMLFGYLVHDSFVFDTLASYVFFFAVLAFVDSFGEHKRELQAIERPVSDNLVKYIAVPITVVILAVVVYFFNVRPLLANIYLSMANATCSKPDADVGLFNKALSFSTAMSSQDILNALIPCTDNIISNPLISGKVKQSFIDLTVAQIKSVIADTPNDAYAYYVGGPFLKQIGKFSDAESALNKAHMLAPNEQVISFELASVYLFENKKDQAVAVLGQAYESAPGYGNAASAYAVALMIAGREADARQVFGADSGLLDKVKAYISSGQPSQATAVYQSIIAQPESIDTLVQQARIQYAAGNTAQAIGILRAIESDHPEAKDQIEAAIKAVQP